jgi:TonB-linked SusC/RagA family outer membrane protein
MKVNNQLRGKVCLLVLGVLLTGMRLFAQNNDFSVRGTVKSDTAALEGVTISVKSNPGKATKTDEKGNFLLKAPANGTLIFSMVGFENKEVDIKGESSLHVILKAAAGDLNEVAVVAYGTQRKSTMAGAVTTINPKELKGATSNLTTMLQGRLAGIIAYQRSGEPGADNASFFIRGVGTFGAGKKDPLILIDGIESSATDLARLQPDDIAAFSLLKDATASSVYGARGANGVIQVATRPGVEGRTSLTVRYENSRSANVKAMKMADNVSYMKLANEAIYARYNNPTDLYSRDKIEGTAAGKDPVMYPSNDWVKRLIKDHTTVQRTNVNLRGGGKSALYYVSGTYNVDNGLLNVDGVNNFNNNIKLKNYSLRANIDFDPTSTTHITARTYGQFDDYNGPVGGGQMYFDMAKSSNPVRFPAIYPASMSPSMLHPLFGNAQEADLQKPNAGYAFKNPYANMLSGYQDYNHSQIQVQLELKQNLNALIDGLQFRVMAYTERYSELSILRRYSPFFYSVNYTPGTKTPQLIYLNQENDKGTEYLGYEPGLRIISTINYAEAALNYNHRFHNVHEVGAMVIGNMRNNLTSAAYDLQQSLPSRNKGVSGRFSYVYDSRYITELTFGYNGSERFAENHRFGFFPSASVAWNIHNERFFSGARGVFNRLKVRASYGLVGNDQIGDSRDRFFYLSNVFMNDPAKSAVFGENREEQLNGISVQRYENRDISWEKAYKTNLGLEATLWNKLNVTVDFWRELRTNILMDRQNIPATMGLGSVGIRANAGEASSRGMEVQADYTVNFDRWSWIVARGNFTYAASKYRKLDELPYPEPYRSKVGHSLSQRWGLIAERLFIDEEEVQNSPQQWADARAGDIKYRDINGDGVVEGNGDQVPIGYPTEPEITYGFGFTTAYKGIEFSAFFSGTARSSIFIDNESLQPYRTYDEPYNGYFPKGKAQNGLIKEIADNHYSEDNRNVYAFWPRMSDYTVTNNRWTSTWWLRSGNFLRLKSLELAYNVQGRALSKMRLKALRVYANAVNLFVLSPFKLWDPEMGSNATGYPPQKVLNLGVYVTF